jgi:hypothetical protein
MRIMREIKRVDIKSSAKILGIFSIISILIDFIFAKIIPNGSGAGLEWNIILTTSVVGAVSFFILGMVLIFIYNSLSNWIGGIKVEI